MPDDADLQELQEEKSVRVSAMRAGLIAAAVALCAIVGTAMWYDGWFSDELGVAVVPSNPAGSSTAASPASTPPASTVGQTPQSPAPTGSR